MHFQMAMHEPHPWIVRSESDSCPATGGHAHSISLGRIHEIEFGRVLLLVIVPKPSSNNEEIEAMKMDGMILHCQHAGALKYQLHR